MCGPMGSCDHRKTRVKEQCANYMNQTAIDEALDKANKEMMEQERQCGMEVDHEPIYTLGTNCCMQCDYGMGLEASETMQLLKLMANMPIKRVCFKLAQHSLRNVGG